MDMKFTESVTNALSNAVKDAETRRNTEVTEQHVLVAFFKQESGYFNTLCGALNLDPRPLVGNLETKLKSLPTYSESGPTPALVMLPSINAPTWQVLLLEITFNLLV